MPRFLAALVLCTAAAEAQIPHGHLIYVHRQATSTLAAMGIVDPDFGTATLLLPQTGTLLNHGSRSVAIDPVAPATLYSLTTLSTSISMVVPVLQLVGNRFTRTTLPVNLGAPGLPFSVRFASGHGLLLLGRGGQINRMFLRNMTTGVVTSQPTPTLLPNYATDMVVIGSNAYAISEGDGSATAVGTVVEWDLATNTDRVVGTNYPPLSAVAGYAGLLLAGDLSGNLHFVDPATGAASLFMSTSLGKITSLAVDHMQRVFVVAESGTTWSIHNVFQPQPALHVTTQPIDDLAIGPSPVPTMLTFGAGCVGSNALVPSLGFSGPPGLGTTFGVTLANALPNAGALLVIGGSRVADLLGPLPRDLAIIGMPGCTQWTDLALTAFTFANGAGAGVLNIALPGDPALAGSRLAMEWLCLDFAANPFGATTSSGGEIYAY
ncbi:MAG TPA: hypothetical protein VF384_15045 [Planctomycetota bacterium]